MQSVIMCRVLHSYTEFYMLFRYEAQLLVDPNVCGYLYDTHAYHVLSFSEAAAYRAKCGLLNVGGFSNCLLEKMLEPASQLLFFDIFARACFEAIVRSKSLLEHASQQLFARNHCSSLLRSYYAATVRSKSLLEHASKPLCARCHCSSVLRNQSSRSQVGTSMLYLTSLCSP